MHVSNHTCANQSQGNGLRVLRRLWVVTYVKTHHALGCPPYNGVNKMYVLAVCLCKTHIHLCSTLHTFIGKAHHTIIALKKPEKMTPSILDSNTSTLSLQLTHYMPVLGGHNNNTY